MASTFPTTLDTFVNPQYTDQVSVVDHALQHQTINSAVAALEAKVGINGSAVTGTVDYKLQAVSDQAVGLTATQTLANKTLTAPTVTSPTTTGTDTGAQTLTHKTITDPTNTVAAAALLNATSAVNVAAGPAPSGSGQFLLTTSATAATWQPYSGGTPDYSVRVTDTTGQSVMQNGATAATWNTEQFNTDTMHSTVTNTSRITFTHAGKYLITASAAPNQSTVSLSADIRVNGSLYIARSYGQAQNNSGSNYGGGASVTTLYQAAAGDYVELMTGSTNTGVTLASSSFFGAHRFA
jgi:hypothetical protein